MQFKLLIERKGADVYTHSKKRECPPTQNLWSCHDLCSALFILFFYAKQILGFGNYFDLCTFLWGWCVFVYFCVGRNWRLIFLVLHWICWTRVGSRGVDCWEFHWFHSKDPYTPFVPKPLMLSNNPKIKHKLLPNSPFLQKPEKNIKGDKA